jgi:predicted amidohydrolase
MLTVALMQTQPRFLEPDANHRAALELISGTEADLYLLPELYLSGYAFSTEDQVRSCAFESHNPYLHQLKELSAECGIAVCGGYAELGENGCVYNSSFLIGDGRLLANYRKAHLFFREKEFFTPGETGFLVTEYHGVRLGMMICFDWIFPESARSLALLGAQVILHPSNLVLPYCQRAMYARAVENRVFVATANRVGRETNSFGDDLTFTGGSQVVSPQGEYVLEFDQTERGIRTVDIDPDDADNKRLNEYNTILAELRPELYVTTASASARTGQ